MYNSRGFLAAVFFSCQCSAVPILIDVPVFVNGEEAGQGEVFIDPESGELDLFMEGVSGALGRVLSTDGITHFQEVFKEGKKIEEGERFIDDKIFVRFEPRDQSLQVGVDPHLVQTTNQKVKKAPVARYEKVSAIEVPQSRSSGYINVMAGHKFNRSFYVGYPYSSNETFGNFDWVFNVNRVVFEGFGYYLGSNKNGLNRGNLLVSYDAPDKQMRVSAGNINTLGIGYQNAIPLTGLSVQKNYHLFADAAVGPASRYEFFLNVPSTVEVYLDGILIKTLQLRAGPHILEDFPLVEGMNNVILKIITPTGEERTVDLNYFYNPEMPAVDTTEYYFALGFPSYNPNQGVQGYNSFLANPTLTTAVNQALSQKLAVAGYFQADTNSAFAGGEVSYVCPYFRAMGDLGGSWIFSHFLDLRTRISLTSNQMPANWFKWKVAGEYIGKRFGYLGQTKPINLKEWIASGTVQWALAKKLSLGFVAEYNHYRDGINSIYGQVLLSASLFRCLSVKAIGRMEQITGGRIEKSVAIGIDLVPFTRDLSIRSNYNSRQKTSVSEATYSKSLGKNRGIALHAGYTSAQDANQATGGIQFDTPRGNLSASHYISQLSSLVSQSTMSTTMVNIGTAFAFANRAWTVSRPIRDSFIIISTNKYLKNTPLLVNPTPSGDYLAKATYYLPALVPVSSYKATEVQLSTETELIAGSDFVNQQYTFNPSYKAGGLLLVGEEPTYIIEGILCLEDDQPLQNTGGLLIHGGGKIHRFFTDSIGRFQIIGVPAGEYQLKTTKEGLPPTTITISSSSNLYYIDLGVIKL